MPIELPDFSLVVLMGASGSGKSTFAERHFLPTEILSSDYFRAVVSDDETDQSATQDAFDALHHLTAIRLRRRKRTVIDATNVQEGARKPLLELARRYHAVPVAIVLDVPEKICHERNVNRPNRNFGKHVVERHIRELRRSLKGLQREGFRHVYHLNGLEAMEAATFDAVPLRPDRRSETGGFDIIGDVHGCLEELLELLGLLGYAPNPEGVWSHSEGRRAVFVGDLVDRGPDSVGVVRLVLSMVQAGTAFCVPGNHDDKLKRTLQGRKTEIKHGLEVSLAQIHALPDTEQDTFTRAFVDFIEELPTHLWLDGGKLVVAHAGLPESMHGRSSGTLRTFALYGDITGETDSDGLPIRRDWAQEYRGEAMVVYGHTPTAGLEWVNNTLNLDTGCVFGGELTALRYPERQTVSVSAKATYAESARPLLPQTDGVSEQWRLDDVPDIADFMGRRTVETRLRGRMVVAEENAAAALEVLSRFAVHPRWLLYLPPTMSPVETTKKEGFLEYPEEAFACFASQGEQRVICQEKHMGSRAVLVVCRNPEVARQRFGAATGEVGVMVTRTGRPFFDNPERTAAILTEAGEALERANLWAEWNTDWVCLDAEIMPWNAKAQGLLREQYAPVAIAGEAVLSVAERLWKQAEERGLAGAEENRTRTQIRLSALRDYRTAYRRYCWQVNGVADLKIAPFHVLAGEGQTFLDRPHRWHMEMMARLAEVSPLFQATEWITVDTTEAESIASGVRWWEEKTACGGEGMVVKPEVFIPAKGQPAVKVRGREYLRIIYGPEYTMPENLARLKERGLGRKRSLALQEFALGVEALERFIRREPLRRVHECVFSILSLESEPVDPRL